MFARLMNKNLADGEAIISPWISKAIETAQKKVEARNYDIRKQVVEYDDVMNDQRKVIYEQRADIMDADTVGDVVDDMRAETVNALVGEAIPPNSYPEQWDIELLKERIDRVFGSTPPFDDWVKEEAVEPEMFVERLQALADAQIERQDRRDPGRRLDPGRKADPAPERSTITGRSISSMLDALRQVVHLRAYAQKKPIDEYKHEAFAMFERMLAAIREDVTGTLAARPLRACRPQELPELPDFLTTPYRSVHAATTTPTTSTPAPARSSRACRRCRSPQPDYARRRTATVIAPASRNAPCPCGSGRKYKHCHGAMA